MYLSFLVIVSIFLYFIFIFTNIIEHLFDGNVLLIFIFFLLFLLFFNIFFVRHYFLLLFKFPPGFLRFEKDDKRTEERTLDIVDLYLIIITHLIFGLYFCRCIFLPLSPPLICHPRRKKHCRDLETVLQWALYPLQLRVVKTGMFPAAFLHCIHY